MKYVRMDLPITPVPMSRPRVTKKGVVYYDERAKKFVSDVKMLAGKELNAKGLEPTEAPVNVILAFVKDVNSELNAGYGDVDNLAKGVLDALNGLLYKDDRQIINLMVVKDIGAEVHYMKNGITIIATDDVSLYYKEILTMLNFNHDLEYQQAIATMSADR